MGKQVSHAGKKQFGAYKSQNRYSANKLRKLKRHMKKYPNDKKTEEVLATGLKVGFEYTRKTPISPVWSKSDKRLAKLMYDFDGTIGKQFLQTKKERLRVHTGKEQ